MDANAVFQKTGRGDAEVKQRGAKLPPKVRTMLIMIDGTRTYAQLQAIAQRLGVAEDYVGMLSSAGFIARIDAAGQGPSAAVKAAIASSAAPASEAERFMAARRFMNDTVVNAIGLRAFFFTLKIEKCSTRADLAALLEDYGKAITKGAGAEEAAVLLERAKELLA